MSDNPKEALLRLNMETNRILSLMQRRDSLGDRCCRSIEVAGGLCRTVGLDESADFPAPAPRPAE